LSFTGAWLQSAKAIYFVPVDFGNQRNKELSSTKQASIQNMNFFYTKSLV